MRLRLDPLARNGLSAIQPQPSVITGVSTSSGGGGNFAIPELTSDPVSPDPESAWVLKTGGGGSGGGLIHAFLGGGAPYPTVGSGSATVYEFSYFTLEGSTIRVTMS